MPYNTKFDIFPKTNGWVRNYIMPYITIFDIFSQSQNKMLHISTNEMSKNINFEQFILIKLSFYVIHNMHFAKKSKYFSNIN